MNSHALRYPLIVSAIIHVAVLSGFLTGGIGTLAFGRETSVVFIGIESPGNDGRSGASGGRSTAAQPSKRPEPAPSKPKHSPPPDQGSARLESEKESVPIEKTGQQESGREETGYGELLMQGDGGESDAGFDAYALGGDPGGSLNGNGAINGVAGESSSAAIANLPKPAYPRYSRIRGEEGTVVLEAEVAADGKPAKARVVRSSGHRHLDDAALNALKRASFIPAKLFGTPVESTKRISVRFNIMEQ